MIFLNDCLTNGIIQNFAVAVTFWLKSQRKCFFHNLFFILGGHACFLLHRSWIWWRSENGKSRRDRFVVYVFWIERRNGPTANPSYIHSKIKQRMISFMIKQVWPFPDNSGCIIRIHIQMKSQGNKNLTRACFSQTCFCIVLRLAFYKMASGRRYSYVGNILCT